MYVVYHGNITVNMRWPNWRDSSLTVAQSRSLSGHSDDRQTDRQYRVLIDVYLLRWSCMWLPVLHAAVSVSVCACDDAWLCSCSSPWCWWCLAEDTGVLLAAVSDAALAASEPVSRVHNSSVSAQCCTPLTTLLSIFRTNMSTTTHLLLYSK